MNGKKRVCKTCGGSGEIGYFQGESRFIITREECPACYGFGYMLEEENRGKVVPCSSDPASEKDIS